MWSYNGFDYIYRRKVSVLCDCICEKGSHLPVVGYIYISERERERELERERARERERERESERERERERERKHNLTSTV